MKMEKIRYFAWSVCVCCILAGVVKAVWPESSLKPVINAILVLYIVAAALEGLPQLSAGEIRRTVEQLPLQGETPGDYSDYLEQSYRQQVAAALQQQLSENRIDAQVEASDDGVWNVTVESGERENAESFLQKTLPQGGYRLMAREGSDG